MQIAGHVASSKGVIDTVTFVWMRVVGMIALSCRWLKLALSVCKLLFLGTLLGWHNIFGLPSLWLRWICWTCI